MLILFKLFITNLKLNYLLNFSKFFLIKYIKN